MKRPEIVQKKAIQQGQVMLGVLGNVNAKEKL